MLSAVIAPLSWNAAALPASASALCQAGAHGCRSAARVLFDWEVGAVGRGVR